MKKGDLFVTPDGDRIEVRRVHGRNEWADIAVIQPHGACWIKRQPLIDGEFAFAADQRIELHDDDGTLMGYMTINTRRPHEPVGTQE
jgi:hypothetical protein